MFVWFCLFAPLALFKKKFLVIAVKQMHVTWGVLGGCVGYFSKQNNDNTSCTFGFMGLSAYMRKMTRKPTYSKIQSNPVYK